MEHAGKTTPPFYLIDQERRVLYGLACEWEHAMRLLDPVYAAVMRRPLFSLKDLVSRWGTWSRDRQEICLSRTLALNYAWDDVRDVLLHEVALQLTDQVFEAFSDPSHGPVFHKACALLGARPQASGTFPTLQDRLHRAAAASGDRRATRVRKLLALAESSNRHEAEAAMLKAHELIARHTIAYVDTGRPREYLSVFAGKPALRHNRFHCHLAALLRDFYFVLPVWVPAYVLEKGRMGRVLEISGTAKNLETAGHVFGLIERVRREEWQRLKGHIGTRGADFGVGLIQGIRARLETAAPVRSEPERPGFALVNVFDPQLRAYGKRRYGRLVRKTGAAGRSDRRALEAGRRIGSALIISNNRTERITSTLRLPPGAADEAPPSSKG